MTKGLIVLVFPLAMWNFLFGIISLPQDVTWRDVIVTDMKSLVRMDSKKDLWVSQLEEQTHNMLIEYQVHSRCDKKWSIEMQVYLVDFLN